MTGTPTVFLLTASIDPMGRVGVRRADPAVRLGDYTASLGRWLDDARRHGAEVVFCENSGWPLESLRALVASRGLEDRVRFLQFRGNDYPRERGKGFGEAAILDRAIAEDLGARPPGTLVVKCTGRLHVSNLDRALLRPGARAEIACALDGRLTQADSRFFLARAGVFAARFTDMGEEVDEPAGILLEHVLCRRVLGAVAAGVAWEPLGAVPRFSGWSATHARSYGGASRLARWAAHSALRTLRYRPRAPL